MNPGGVSEAIAHFAGHLRVYEDVARHGEIYAGDRHLPTVPWAPTFRPGQDPERSLDELPIRPFSPDLGSEAQISFGGLKGLVPRKTPIPFLPQGAGIPKTHPEITPSVGSGAGHGKHAATDGPDPSPHPVLAETLQVNALHDDDTILMTDDRAVLGLHAPDAVAALPHLVDWAHAQVPESLTGLQNGTEALVHGVSARDAAHAASGGEGLSADFGTGTVIDGVRQPDGTRLHADMPEAYRDGPAGHNGLTDPGLDAVLGRNLSVNSATIIDDNTQHRGLIVFGDAHTTNAVIQANVLSSRADISIGGSSDRLDLLTDGNLATNGAALFRHETGGASFSRGTYGEHVQVDRIEGDFYDVRSLNQVNWLSDNDTVVQGTFHSYYTAVAGANQQVNVVSFEELAQRYDLIVVEGSYHASNIVIQTNVLLNDAVIRAYTGRDDTVSQTITSGDNTLTNRAQIDLYGHSAYGQAGHDMLAAARQLGDGVLDQHLAGQLPANGAHTLNVLYVTGDFYNLNLIAQTNVLANIDTAIQYMPNPGTTLSPLGTPMTSTESVTTGANSLLNAAQITSVGTTTAFQYVGGHHYDDAVLVQANLVSDHKAVVFGNTQALVPELIAFTGLQDAHAPEPELPHAQPAHDPSLSHDLFHGMMT
ncbi:hypothetical protein [Methylobacterium sp. A54F]